MVFDAKGLSSPPSDSQAGRSFTCRVCGHQGDLPAWAASEKMFGLGGRFDYVQCPQCGCLQIATIPADLSPYYPNDYYSLQPLKVDTTPGLKGRLRRLRLRAYLAGLPGEGLWRLLFGARDFFPWLKLMQATPDKALLDVGTGSGSFLRDLHDFGFSDLTGIDPFLDGDHRHPGGITVLKRGLDADLGGTFDLVTAHHSLEHMPDQAGALAHLRRLLAPGGRLLIRVPVVPNEAWQGFGADWAGLDPPRHLTLHSVESLTLLAQKAGLQLLTVTYDSSDFQFWGSEQYQRGVALHAPTSWAVDRRASAYTKAQIRRFRARARALNRQGRGDSACFFFKIAGEDRP